MKIAILFFQRNTADTAVRMKFFTVFLLLILSLLIVGGCKQPTSSIQQGNSLDSPKYGEWVVQKPPKSLELDPFYKKYVYVNGIHIISSWRVPDSALFRACDIIMYMTDALPKAIHKELTIRNTRVAVMARYEGTTDIPEHRYLEEDTSLNWDVRARGLGGEVDLPLTTCAEENLLCYQIDKYHAEEILIHEFAHTIHGVGILPMDPKFNEKLQQALDAAVAEGKWDKTYAKTNVMEYMAEGVQDWFNVNAEVPVPDGKHNHVNTRIELKEYDPRLYAIIGEIFPEIEEDISCHCYTSK